MIIAGPCTSGLQVARHHHFQQRCNQCMWALRRVAASAGTLQTCQWLASRCNNRHLWRSHQCMWVRCAVATRHWTQRRLPFVLHSAKSVVLCHNWLSLAKHSTKKLRPCCFYISFWNLHCKQASGPIVLPSAHVLAVENGNSRWSFSTKWKQQSWQLIS